MSSRAGKLVSKGRADYLCEMPEPTGNEFVPPTLDVAATWEAVAEALRSADFEARVLPALLRESRWFGGKAHPLRNVRVLEILPVGALSAGRLALLEANYADRPSEVYLLPLQLAAAPAEAGAKTIAHMRGSVLFDAVADEAFRAALFELVLRERREGELGGVCGVSLKSAELALPLGSRALAAEQSNSAIVYADRFFLKLYRKPEAGENPDAELIRFLSERQKFAHVPAFCGAIEHRADSGESRTLALMVAHVPCEGDAWAFTLASMHDEKYPARVRQLGQRTAEMHLALAADRDDPAFTPEPITAEDRRALCDAARENTRQTMRLLESKLPDIPENHRGEAAILLTREDEILDRLSAFAEYELIATKTRHHGDYHLGQVLNTGSDFVIIDFEGEPARSLAERRMKRSPLRDVAGMLRSFHYAAHAALEENATMEVRDSAETWAVNTARIFLDAWLATAKGASFIPEDPDALKMLLDVHLLEKAIYEVAYELNHRPHWAFIPVRGISQILTVLNEPPR